MYRRSPYPLSQPKEPSRFYEEEDDDELPMDDTVVTAHARRQQKVLVLQWTYMILGSLLVMIVWATIRTLSGRR